ncbi:hypothetical protein RJT34_28472 [Clitoria ternatea]|uniref:RRM domain-containing protein n=1 Tax=Clitoria ternatea TaxID=43366 RepID=A0AAN9FDW5_CLITE
MSGKVFVSRLSFFTTTKRLKALFSPFGAVTDANIVIDGKTGRPKGFGFVTYESQTQAEKAIKVMNGRFVDGRLIFVAPAKGQ